jgi:hypothetical protein
MRLHTKIGRLLKRQIAAENLAELSLLLLLGFMLAMSAWIYPVLIARSGEERGGIPITGGFEVSLRQTLGEIGGATGESPWVTKAVFDTTAPSFPFVLMTRAQRATLLNQPAALGAQWVSADPRVALVARVNAELNSISILTQGSTRVTVVAGGASKTLYISAAYLSPGCDTLRVVISLAPQPDLAVQTCKLVLPLVVNGD